MHSRWSWIFFFYILLCQCSSTLAQSVNTMSMASNNTTTPPNDVDGSHAVATVDIIRRPQVIGPIIAGAIVALFVVVVFFVCMYFYIRGPPPTELEDGVSVNEKPPVSGRKWFSSKTGRFKVDDPNQPVKKLSAVPRYLRVFRRSAGWSDQPVPGTPTIPRSARIVAGDSMVTLSLPASASPTTQDVFNQMDRSDRRKVQVAAQPLAPLPSLASPRRKSIFPSFMRYGAAKPPMKREEIVQQLVHKQQVVANLEEKSRKHQHQVHGSIDSFSTTATCVVDQQFEQDITELRTEVKALEKMLPERSHPPPNYI